MAIRPSITRIRLIVLGTIVAFIAAVHLSHIIPGVLEERPFVGPPNSNAIYSTGGFHCPGDGPNYIHFHTCDGPSYALPSGTKPSDYPNRK